ncbi:hypothetical protein ACH5RR_001158 [Cinchona calisaya]|uniref:SHSP domain-containing protein n=1 Tax=Cinchona calisaya TaxID=153742 RepID=A0ABD3B3T0_9GENT
MALRRIRDGKATPTTPSRPQAGVQPVYEDFRPISEWQQDEESDILVILLPGFMRQHLNVSTEGKNIVIVRGERLVTGNKWNRFQKDYQVPEACNIRIVHARFEGGILTITMPWKKDNQTQDRSKESAKVTSTEAPPKTISTPEIHVMSPQKAPIEPRPQKAADDKPSKPISTSETQKQETSLAIEKMEPRPSADDTIPETISPQDRKMSPRKAPLEPMSQKDADDTIPKTISPQDRKMSPRKAPLEPMSQKDADDTIPKTISPQDRKMSPRKAPLEPMSQKDADDIPPKVLTLPSFTADKVKDEKMLSEPQTQKAQDEQSDRTRSRTTEPITATFLTSVDDRVEKKAISSETKEKPMKLDNIEKFKGGVGDKKSIENKEAIHDQAENIKRKISHEKRKSEAIDEKAEYTGQKIKKNTALTSIDSVVNYKKGVENLAEHNERQLLLNIGVAVLVIVALGTYISYTVGSGKA